MTSLSILWIFPRTTSELLSVHYPACILVSQNNCSSEMNIFFSFISSNLLRNSDLNTLIPTKLLTEQRKYNYNVFFSQKKKKKTPDCTPVYWTFLHPLGWHAPHFGNLACNLLFVLYTCTLFTYCIYQYMVLHLLLYV